MSRDTYNLKEIAALVDGDLFGSEEIIVSGITNLQDATQEMLSFAVPPHIEAAEQSSAAAVIIGRDIDGFSKTHIKVDNPRMAFAKLLDFFYGYKKPAPQIHTSAVIDDTAVIGKNVVIMANVVIDKNAVVGDECVLFPGVYVGTDSKIGKNSTLFPNVAVYHGCLIGSNCILHAGAVIGADGFGFVTEGGIHHKVPQVGNVIIEDNVEIGANSTVDRAATGSTVVGAGTKLDNLVHLGHNVHLGKGCLAAAYAGFAGSTIVGDYCTFGAQCGTAGHNTIGNNCMFAARAGISANVDSGSFLAGYPLKPFKQWMRDVVALGKISETAAKVRTLEKKISVLENKQTESK